MFWYPQPDQPGRLQLHPPEVSRQQAPRIQVSLLSGWEVRNSNRGGAGTLLLLDPHVATKVVRTSGDVQLVFNGIEGLGRSAAILGINAFANLNTGVTDGLSTARVTLTNAGTGYPANLENKGDVSLVAGSTTGSKARVRISTNASGAIRTDDPELMWAITRSGEVIQSATR